MSENLVIFSPQKFHLKPGDVKTVQIKLNLPISMEPGKYFAYLEGHPSKKAQTSNTSVGVAAAAKLYFSVEQANLAYGIYYKIISFWNVYAPWPQRISIVLAAILVILLFKKFFNIEINVKKPKKEISNHKHNE